MARLDQDRQNKLQPTRMEKAKEEISKLGFKIIFQDETEIRFEFRGKTVYYFPYSGWASGTTIMDGRGLQKLLDQIKI